MSITFENFSELELDFMVSEKSIFFMTHNIFSSFASEQDRYYQGFESTITCFSMAVDGANDVPVIRADKIGMVVVKEVTYGAFK